MDTPTRTVRVFLSSTFRDFAGERDLLVRKIFPDLRRRCRERQVELVDVDLRWGITEEEAQQGKVLPICLAEIDRSRPFFMGFLGERYGWVPEAGQYDLSLLLEQPWLEEHRGGKSVTELEILHGVLDNPAMEKRAFFYFRDPSWSEAQGGAYLAEGPAEQARLAELKERIRQSGFPFVENYASPEELAERVREDLWKLIDEAYPESEVPDALARERMTHEAFGATRRRLYLGGEAYFAALDAAMADEPFRPVLVRGQSGGGKSALLANWVASWSERHPGTSIIVHHLGCGADAADPERMEVRLIREMARLTGDEFGFEPGPQRSLQHWLELARGWAQRSGGELLLVLDGLDTVSTHPQLPWFPGFLPAGVKLVASCLDGEILAAAKTRLDWRELEIAPFTPQEQLHFIGEYLGRYRKALTPGHSDSLRAHPLSGNPLFLLTVLEELRVFGVHEQLESRLHALLSPPPGKPADEEPTVDDVFEHVLARIEEDLGRGAVQSAMESIWASRGGLYQDELLAIAGITPATWAAMQNALDEALYESAGRIQFGHDYLRKAVEDRYSLSGTLKAALHRRLAEWFAGQEVDGHVAAELPWQWLQSGDQDQLEKCLLEKSIFEESYVLDKYDLLRFWLELGFDVSTAYEQVYESWQTSNFCFPRWLGDFLRTAGYFGEFTENLFKWSLEAHEKKFGPEDHFTLESAKELGALLETRGDCAGAEKFFRQALEGYEKEFGPDHFFTLRSLNSLGINLEKQRKYVEAEALFRRALERKEKFLGPDHRDTLRSADNLGLLLNDRGEFEEAESLFRRAIEGKEKALGPEDPDTLSSVQNLGILFETKGDYEVAEALYRRVVASKEKTFGPEHPDTLCDVLRLASLLVEKGENDGAESLCRRALSGLEKALGPGHPATLRCVQLLEILLREMGNFEGGLTLIRRWMNRQDLSGNLPELEVMGYNLACYECHFGHHDEARRIIREHLARYPNNKHMALTDDSLAAIREWIENLP